MAHVQHVQSAKVGWQTCATVQVSAKDTVDPFPPLTAGAAVFCASLLVVSSSRGGEIDRVNTQFGRWKYSQMLGGHPRDVLDCSVLLRIIIIFRG